MKRQLSILEVYSTWRSRHSGYYCAGFGSNVDDDIGTRIRHQSQYSLTSIKSLLASSRRFYTLPSLGCNTCTIVSKQYGY